MVDVLDLLVDDSMRTLLTLLLILSLLLHVQADSPASFYQSKQVLKGIYADHPETFYCGCRIDWARSKPIHNTCGYEVRKNLSRANRVEWEHVVAAQTFGQQLPCWRKGGRAECAKDPQYKRMEADMHNLVPAIGEINGDRSNYRFGVLPGSQGKYGNCPVKIDFKQRVIEPRAEVRGDIARINFYMYDRYGLRMSRQQQQLFVIWNKQDPVSDWERVRDLRILAVGGSGNPFVYGGREWKLSDGL